MGSRSVAPFILNLGNTQGDG